MSDGAVRQLLNRARNTLRAGATALAPAGWLARIPWESSAEPLAARVGEGLGAAGVGALAAKVCATALVTGAVVGGVAVVPDEPESSLTGRRRAANGSKTAGRLGLGGGAGWGGVRRRAEPRARRWCLCEEGRG